MILVRIFKVYILVYKVALNWFHENLFEISAQKYLNRKMQYSVPNTLFQKLTFSPTECHFCYYISIFLSPSMTTLWQNTRSLCIFFKIKLRMSVCMLIVHGLAHSLVKFFKNFVFLRIIIVDIINGHLTVVINGCFFFQEDDCSVQLEWKNAAACRLLDLSDRSINLLPNASTRK